MSNRLDRDLSLGVVGLVVLLLVGGISVVHKANGARWDLDPLPAAHRPLSGLPIGAAYTIPAPHVARGFCHTCHPVAANRDVAAPLVAAPPVVVAVVPDSRVWQTGPWPQPPMAGEFRDTAQAAFAVPQGPRGGSGLLTPREQNAASKMMVEGHWLGMEVMDLTQALRRVYKIPAGVMGVIVDEITLESAESGILAGDVLTSIQGRQTRDLGEFCQATWRVGERKKANIIVHRRGMEVPLVLAARNTPSLGFAQMEGAPPIRPGALSPHRTPRQACTECHVIMMTGGQLPIDGGDIVPTPPPIQASAQAPHPYRGACNACHVLR